MNGQHGASFLRLWLVCVCVCMCMDVCVLQCSVLCLRFCLRGWISKCSCSSFFFLAICGDADLGPAGFDRESERWMDERRGESVWKWEIVITAISLQSVYCVIFIYLFFLDYIFIPTAYSKRQTTHLTCTLINSLISIQLLFCVGCKLYLRGSMQLTKSQLVFSSLQLPYNYSIASVHFNR